MNNIYLIFLFFLMISCVNDKKINQSTESNELLESKKPLEETPKIISSDAQLLNEQEIQDYANLQIVSPDQLKIDGYQRYFLNDTLFTGISRQYQGELLLFEIHFLRGRKHGVSTFWHENGQKKSILTFENGKAKGDFKVWDKSGNLLKQGVN